MLLSTALVSLDAQGTRAAHGNSDFSIVSSHGNPLPAPPQSPQGNLGGDGTRLVFTSDATDLVGSLGDTAGASKVYVRDLTTGRTSLVSATPAGRPGNGDSFDPVISPDGRYVAFLSQATDLSSVDASSDDLTGSSTAYLYVRDLRTGTTTLLDQKPGGHASDGGSTGTFVFSPDSKSLAFIDTSDNLTGAPVDPGSGSRGSSPGWGPTTQPQHVYLRDLAGQATSLVSASMAGAASGINSVNPIDSSSQLAFSPDSRSLVFASDATDLTSHAPSSPSNPDAGLPNASMNLFLRDLKAGTTTLLTPTTGGALAQGGSMDPIFSPDGHSVAFLSSATGLTANPVGPDGSGLNLYIRDLRTGTTRLVSATPGGQLSSGEVSSPAFSPDGSSLAYLSTATDLTKNTPDSNLPPDQTPPPGALGQGLASNMSTLPASVGPASVGPVTVPAQMPTAVTAIPMASGIPTVATPASGPPLGPEMPAGGPSSPFGGQDVFLNDLKTGATTLITATPGGQLSSGWAGALAFSPDGRYLAFTSDAGDLTSNAFESKPPAVPGVPPGILAMAMSTVSNVFVHDLQTGRTSLASVTTGGLLSDGTSGGLIFSLDSRSLFFTSTALDLTKNPPDTSNGPLSTWGAPPNNLFVRDLAAGTTLVSATTGGLLSGTTFTSAVLSPDGRTVYFDSDAANLTAGDSGGSMNIFAATAPFATPTPTPVHPPTPGPVTPPVKSPVTPPSTTPATPASTTNTPPSTASHTATPTPAATTPAPAPVADPGPTVVSVAPVKGRRGITELVITFDRALAAATAQDTANYQVSLPGRAIRLVGGHRMATRPARSIAVTAAAYDAATDQVILTLRTKLHPGKTTQLEINGTSGGVASTDGVPLNSPNQTKPGQDYLATLDLAARRR
jgi:Tol biopolymer transport system component